jgi:hypothetical protein
MRAADFQSRKAVEHAVEDEPRQEKRRLEGIADDVAEVAAAFEDLVLHQEIRVGRVHEHRHLQLFGLAPERIVFLARRRFALDVAADGGPLEPELLDGIVQLLGRQIGMLQRGRRQPDEAFRIRLAPFRDAFVMHAHDLGREVALGRIPPILVDGDHLHVDAARIHAVEAILPHDLRHGVVALDVGPRQQFARFGNDEMAVDVDHFDVLAGDLDLLARDRSACAWAALAARPASP